MVKIHRDKNGNPLKGAALHSHIIYTHDGGPEAHDAAFFQDGFRKGVREQINAGHATRTGRRKRNILQNLFKR